MKIGAMELLIVFIVALIVIGPDKLPAYARKFGNALREFRKASSDVTQDIRASVVEPLEEAQRPLREAMEPLEELKTEVTDNFKGVEKDLKNIGKEKPVSKPEVQVPESSPASPAAVKEVPASHISTDPLPGLQADPAPASGESAISKKDIDS